MPTPASSSLSLPASRASTTNPEFDNYDPDTQETPLSVPDTGDHGEGGKLKMIVQLLKKALGVKDIAAMRLSLPASLLEPIPNLEYWTYLDRPDLLVAVNNSEDALQRMLSVLRFTFSKDLKFIKGKICKPYNSVLGEHFRAHYDVPLDAVIQTQGSQEPPVLSWFLDPSHTNLNPVTSPINIASAHLKSPSSASLSVKSIKGDLLSEHHYAESSPNLTVPTTDAVSTREPSPTQSTEVPNTPEHVRLAFLTEQVSHHPPISCYYFEAPAKGIAGYGVDQIAARVAGTALKVSPGMFNKGIFLRISAGHGDGEHYHITHPTALVNGILRGSFYATVSESTSITCTGGKGESLRALIEYKEEPWLGQPKFLIEGVIHKYDETSSEQLGWTKVKQVPKDLLVATFEGSWRKIVSWKRAGSSESYPLIDMSSLLPVPKAVRPLAEQLSTESRKLWEGVTSNLLKKEFSEATRIKQEIEQRQRDLAAERKRTNLPFVPAYFTTEYSEGIPTLTEEGRNAINEIINTA